MYMVEYLGGAGVFGWQAWLWRWLTRRQYRRSLEVRLRSGITHRHSEPAIIRRRGELLEIRCVSGDRALYHMGAVDVIRERVIPRAWDKPRRANRAL